MTTRVTEAENGTGLHNAAAGVMTTRVTEAENGTGLHSEAAGLMTTHAIEDANGTGLKIEPAGQTSGLRVHGTKLDRVLLIEPATAFEDFRGAYVELYNRELYANAGIQVEFLQDDYSVSSRHVLRGIHGDRRTWKLVTCPIGRIYLVIVDLEPSSPTYRRWQSFDISESNRMQVLAPPNHGVGHLVMSDRAMFHYKQSTYYDRASQFTVMWNDPAIGVWWPIDRPILSRRDSGLD